MKDDLISRQNAIDALLERDANCGLDSAKVIEQLPPTQPIRCGECRHKNKDGMCRIFKEYVFNDDYFCCYAVQKEGKK